jgi:NTP pyrophosphatase (non-canonical NTP hydrolase)
MKEIDALLDLAREKYLFEKEQKTSRDTHTHYLSWLPEEIAEVQQEVRPDNQIYLENELSDVLRDYLNILYTLEQEWLISSYVNVFDTAYKKYEERVHDKMKGIGREETKARQKKRLIQHHIQKYWTTS